MARINPLTVEEMSADQRRVYDIITSGPRGRVRGPLAVWLHRPGMAEHAQALGQFCRFESALPARLSELGVLVLARWWSSEFEWWAHKTLALNAGLSEAVIDALRDRKPIPFEHDDEALIYEFLTVLQETRRVPDELYQRAEHLFGRHGVIDLVAQAGYYTLIAMTVNVFRIDPPDGAALELRMADGTDQ